MPKFLGDKKKAGPKNRAGFFFGFFCNAKEKFVALQICITTGQQRRCFASAMDS
jgi:hypothetical protein